MTEESKTILEKYQVRKTTKQKSAFIAFLTEALKEKGYEARVEKGSFGVKNIVVGSPRDAKVVFTAHYDTAPRLPIPNFITPKCFLVYLLYQILLTGGIFVIAGLISFAISLVINLCGAQEASITFLPLIFDLIILAELLLILFGPANKNTANDNTSGVITLVEIMSNLPIEDREKVAFVFFDQEETGLVGSSIYSSKHKKETQGKPFINFDCVSDGDNVLFAVRKGARGLVNELKNAFEGENGFYVDVCTSGVFYPSDQMNFPVGIGVATLKRSKRLKMLYMNRIHTSRDTVFEEKNIEFLTQGSLKLVKQLTDKTA